MIDFRKNPSIMKLFNLQIYIRQKSASLKTKLALIYERNTICPVFSDNTIAKIKNKFESLDAAENILEREIEKIFTIKTQDFLSYFVEESKKKYSQEYEYSFIPINEINNTGEITLIYPKNDDVNIYEYTTNDKIAAIYPVKFCEIYYHSILRPKITLKSVFNEDIFSMNHYSVHSQDIEKLYGSLENKYKNTIFSDILESYIEKNILNKSYSINIKNI